MNGYELHRLNIRATEIAQQAINACKRLHQKAHALVKEDNNTTLPLMLYDLYATAPMVEVALKRWLSDTSVDAMELNHRVETCIGILQNELRCNGMFDKLRSGA